jgi:hypothetical protein
LFRLDMRVTLALTVDINHDVESVQFVPGYGENLRTFSGLFDLLLEFSARLRVCTSRVYLCC